jgi:hypothetical protein
MLSFEPNIVVIDDKREEVSGLLDHYQAEGIGTKFYNACIIDGDKRPELPFSNVNLIFLDLYYSSKFDVDLCTSWICSVVPEHSFYILVIWSKDTDHSEEVLKELKEVNRSPYLNLPLQKGDTFKNNDHTWNFKKLYEHIQTDIDKHSGLEELSFWRKSISNASNLILGHLTKDLTQNTLNTKLQRIILGHGGNSYKSKDRQEQKREILFEALDDVLISNAKNQRPEVGISEENMAGLYNTVNIQYADIDSKLNSWFYFKLLKDPLCQKSIKPGVISEFKDLDFEKLYCDLLSDENVKSYLSKQTEAAALDGSNTKFQSIALILSRACDIAQDKYGRNLKLISGLKIVNPVRKENPSKEFKGRNNKSDSIKLFDHLYFSEAEPDVTLIFDFRYIFSVSGEKYVSDFDNVKVFNKDLLSELQVEYSSYSSRLGITKIF